MHPVCELPLRGAGGEPVSFARTVHSHGCARLAPAQLDSSPLRYRRRFRVGARVIEIELQERGGKLVAIDAAALIGEATRASREVRDRAKWW